VNQNENENENENENQNGNGNENENKNGNGKIPNTSAPGRRPRGTAGTAVLPLFSNFRPFFCDLPPQFVK
jgi:hypothetical protein